MKNKFNYELNAGDFVVTPSGRVGVLAYFEPRYHNELWKACVDFRTDSGNELKRNRQSFNIDDLRPDKGEKMWKSADVYGADKIVVLRISEKQFDWLNGVVGKLVSKALQANEVLEDFGFKGHDIEMQQDILKRMEQIRLEQLQQAIRGA